MAACMLCPLGEPLSLDTRRGCIDVEGSWVMVTMVSILTEFDGDMNEADFFGDFVAEFLFFPVFETLSLTHTQHLSVLGILFRAQSSDGVAKLIQPTLRARCELLATPLPESRTCGQEASGIKVIEH